MKIYLEFYLRLLKNRFEATKYNYLARLFNALFCKNSCLKNIMLLISLNFFDGLGFLFYGLSTDPFSFVICGKS